MKGMTELSDPTIELMLKESVRRCIAKFNKYKLQQQKDSFYNSLARDVRIFDKGFNYQMISFPSRSSNLKVNWVWNRFLTKFSGQAVCSLAFILSNVNTVFNLSEVSTSQWKKFTRSKFDWMGNCLINEFSDYNIPRYAEMSIEELQSLSARLVKAQ